MNDPEAAVLAALARLGIGYERLECDPEAADTAIFCARYGIPPERSANTILVASKKEPRIYAVCVVLATTSLDVNHAVRGLLGVSRLSFASAEETVAVTGMLVGGVTPFGVPEGLPLSSSKVHAIWLPWIRGSTSWLFLFFGVAVTSPVQPTGRRFPPLFGTATSSGHRKPKKATRTLSMRSLGSSGKLAGEQVWR